MAILEILEFPDPRLRTKASPVSIVDDEIRQLIQDMAETMYHANGIGLAATQVNIHKRVVVIDTSEEKNDLQVFINPAFTVLTDECHEYDEGCLSVPGFYETVTRPERILVKALNQNGEEFQLNPEGLLAVCIQHEIDHLDGKLFVDYISELNAPASAASLKKPTNKIKLVSAY